jgi:hypothetical protein
MPDQIYIGNFPKGTTNFRAQFVNDNGTFSNLFNAYAWRGRVKRKRGTQFLGRLAVQVISVSPATLPWQDGPITVTAGAFNLLTFVGAVLGASIVPGTINIVYKGQTYVEPAIPNGTLVSAAQTGTINYATGAIQLSDVTTGTATGTFSYYTGLPVMGAKDFTSSVSSSQFPLTVAFDTEFTYQINQTTFPVTFYNVNYFKFTNIPFVWSGQDYQQFWTTNYPSTTSNQRGAFWASNNSPGFNFVKGTYVSGSGTTMITFTFTNGVAPFTTLVVGTSITGDQVWFNEWFGTGSNINNLTGYVSSVVNRATGTYVVTFPSIVMVANADTGIAQLLTNTIPGQDGIKWYDGDPTSGTGLPTGTGLGWVNFAPPLTGSAGVSIANTPEELYYLVGALAIVPFQDRLIFLSPWIQASTGLPIQLQDTALWSWNGTPFYTTPVPLNQTADVLAYYVDQTGLGGYEPAGISNPITTVVNNEDVLIVGFGGDGRKARFVYTGNDLEPFLWFTINSELPSAATYSAITLDKGAIDIGQYGIAMTDQQSSQRVDLDIPDMVFQIQSMNSGFLRVNAIRSFLNEWIYFTYPVNNSIWKFPTQTLFFNYRDTTWALLYENYTCHGRYRYQSKRTWTTLPFKTWSSWREPWNAGSSSALFVDIIAGNPQGFVLIKDKGTYEANSGNISAMVSFGGITQITSVNHCVSYNNAQGQRSTTPDGDYLLINGALGNLFSTITAITLGNPTVITTVNTFSVGQTVFITGVAGTAQLNGNYYQISNATGTSITINVDSTLFTAYTNGGTAQLAINGVIGQVLQTPDANTFIIDIPFPAGFVYTGLGTFARLSTPVISTKQFNYYWQQGKKTRLSVQRYLLDTTQSGQITVEINLSQDADNAWNDPALNVPPNSLVYSQIVFTCPESTNLGLTPANVSLQNQIPSQTQTQIWHRYPTSLIGDSVQITLTLSDAQMRNLSYATDEIVLHGIQLTIDPSMMLS